MARITSPAALQLHCWVHSTGPRHCLDYRLQHEGCCGGFHAWSISCRRRRCRRSFRPYPSYARRARGLVALAVAAVAVAMEFADEELVGSAGAVVGVEAATAVAVAEERGGPLAAVQTYETTAA